MKNGGQYLAINESEKKAAEEVVEGKCLNFRIQNFSANAKQLSK
jgi:hypothetical protein